ncbi:hypothetical protein BgiBS90_014753 [Biomphalaria glabrata]|nr:hypothetical protein BgiBS90_014753 [Biomphalaria glabrata]
MVHQAKKLFEPWLSHHGPSSNETFRAMVVTPWSIKQRNFSSHGCHTIVHQAKKLFEPWLSHHGPSSNETFGAMVVTQWSIKQRNFWCHGCHTMVYQAKKLLVPWLSHHGLSSKETQYKNQMFLLDFKITPLFSGHGLNNFLVNT